jgi:AcrR family transcriptional regulator
MVRLTRAQQQERTRAAVLVAAREEFAARGYVEATVDRIAERAELTRGALYSNFPSKRAVYLAVLVDMVEGGAVGEAPSSPRAVGAALGAFARVWLERLPLALALEARPPGRDRGWPRLVRVAELVLTLLDGAGHLAEAAPGFGDPFDVARACEHLGGIDVPDSWDPPHLPHVAPARPCREAWAPPAELVDLLTGRPVGLDRDGVVALLGSGRLGAAEEAARAAGPGDQVSVVVLTSDPAEIGRLVRLRVGDLAGCARRVLGPDPWPGLRVIVDDRSLVAATAGVPDAGDATEAAVRIQDGEIVARAEGRGAGHAAASAGASDTPRPRGAGA